METETVENISTMGLVEILLIVIHDLGKMPCNRNLLSKVLWELKKCGNSLVLPPCLIKMRVPKEDWGPSDIPDALAPLIASASIEILMPSRRYYVDNDMIDLWRRDHQSAMLEMKDFLQRASQIIESCC